MLEEEAEKDVEEVEEPAEPPKIVEGMRRAFRVGSHVVQELVTDRETTWLKCVICGAEAPLTRIAELKEKPCRDAEGARDVEGEPRESREPENGVCEFCGGEASGRYPASIAGKLMEIWLCGRCLQRYEEFYLSSRPSLTVQRGSKRTTVRGGHPIEGERRVAWVQELSTWFVESEDHRWPCPACGEAFDRLADVVKHFADKHPEKPGWERERIKGVGEAPRTWQGFFCPRCGLFIESEDELRSHYGEHGGGR